MKEKQLASAMFKDDKGRKIATNNIYLSNSTYSSC